MWPADWGDSEITSQRPSSTLCAHSVARASDLSGTRETVAGNFAPAIEARSPDGPLLIYNDHMEDLMVPEDDGVNADA